MNSSAATYWKRYHTVKKQLAALGAKTFGSLERMEERLARFQQYQQKRQAAAARLQQAREDAQIDVAVRQEEAAIRTEILLNAARIRKLASELPPETPSLRAEFVEPPPMTPVSLRANACGDVDEWGPCGPPPPRPILRRQNAVDLTYDEDETPSLPPPPPVSRSGGACLCHSCGWPTEEPAVRVVDCGEDRVEEEEEEEELDEERRRDLRRYNEYREEQFLIDQANEQWRDFLDAAPWMCDEHIDFVIEAMEKLRTHYKKVNDQLYS